MKITILGLGSIGKRHLKTLLKLKKKFKLNEISLFDTNFSRINQLKNNDKNIKIYKTFDDAINGSDVIYVCTPTSSHMSVCKQINLKGKFNIFIEKPLSHNLHDCEEFIELQKSKNKKACGHMLRYNPILNKIKKLVLSKKIESF